MKPGNGKRGIAPCGHAGEHIVSTYVQCLQGCEFLSDDAPPVEFCPYCGKGAIDLDYSLDPDYLFWNPGTVQFNRRCWECGAVYLKGGL